MDMKKQINMSLFMTQCIKISFLMTFLKKSLHYNTYHLVMVVKLLIVYFNYFFPPPLGYLLQVNYNSKYEQVSNCCDIFLKHNQFVNDYVHIRFGCKV